MPNKRISPPSIWGTKKLLQCCGKRFGGGFKSLMTKRGLGGGGEPEVHADSGRTSDKH